jgi:mono/diheme cytochrome c family protein
MSLPNRDEAHMQNPAKMIISAALLGALFVGGNGPLIGVSARAQDTSAGDVAEGKLLYLADGCFLCHGRAGQGGALNGPAPVLANTQLPFEGFVGQLREPINDMPPYGEQIISEMQIADIYAFVQSLPGPRPIKDVPILSD